jgi:hypothetical protein
MKKSKTQRNAKDAKKDKEDRAYDQDQPMAFSVVSPAVSFYRTADPASYMRRQ